jgi:hypothetical protein
MATKTKATVKIQIQTKRPWTGIEQPKWEVYGEWNKKLPKYAMRDYRELLNDEYGRQVRVVRSGEPEFIEAGR